MILYYYLRKTDELLTPILMYHSDTFLVIIPIPYIEHGLEAQIDK